MADLKFHATGPQFRDMTAGNKDATLYETLENVSEMFFGLDRQKLSTATITAVIKRFTGTLNELTADDVEYAFKRAEIVPVMNRTLTLNDLYYPIARWSGIRADIRKARWAIQNESNDQQAREHAAQAFLEESKFIYIASLRKKLWDGSVFHASVLIKAFPEFRQAFSQDEIEGFESDAAKREKAVYNSNLFLQTLAISAEYHFAGLVISECVQRKIIVF